MEQKVELLLKQISKLDYFEKEELLMNLHCSTPDFLKAAIADLEVGIAREESDNHPDKPLVDFWKKNRDALKKVRSTYS